VVATIRWAVVVRVPLEPREEDRESELQGDAAGHLPKGHTEEDREVAADRPDPDLPGRRDAGGDARTMMVGINRTCSPNSTHRKIVYPFVREKEDVLSYSLSMIYTLLFLRVEYGKKNLKCMDCGING